MIKSDRWIRRMALDKGMIEPFEERQVREGAISYGVPSYGYDIRIADQFKIFTNVYNTVVDPKAFDSRSFVDFRGDVCIIPPNSFALGRSVEYFRIPRTVITICLGKCVAGDTQVVDGSTGRRSAIADALTTCGSTPALSGHAVRRADVSEGTAQGVLPVYEVVTGTGRRLRATPNHPLMVFGGWRTVQDVGPGDRVGVPRRLPVFGSRELPLDALDRLGRVLSAGAGDETRHLEWLERRGLGTPPAEARVPAVVFELRRPLLARFLRALFAGESGSVGEGSIELATTSERLARDVQHLLSRFEVVATLRRRPPGSGRGRHGLSVIGEEQIARFAAAIGFAPGSEKQHRLEEALERIDGAPPQGSPPDALPAEAWTLLRQACRARGGSLARMGVAEPPPDRDVPRRLAADVARRLGDEALNAVADSDVLWDIVTEKRFAGFEPVFDLTVPGAANFVADDVFVHNSTYARCGIITNVTPFEPEWEGFVTLEISNTTPLPAKIYANEGIAQVLFFESDEVCAVSYADRQGKYQAQQGIVLPKV
jgi:deoxycytidine triphosphate deaminase